jgi:hypothetical protein
LADGPSLNDCPAKLGPNSKLSTIISVRDCFLFSLSIQVRVEILPSTKINLSFVKYGDKASALFPHITKL